MTEHMLFGHSITVVVINSFIGNNPAINSVYLTVIPPPHASPQARRRPRQPIGVRSGDCISRPAPSQISPYETTALSLDSRCATKTPDSIHELGTSMIFPRQCDREVSTMNRNDMQAAQPTYPAWQVTGTWLWLVAPCQRVRHRACPNSWAPPWRATHNQG